MVAASSLSILVLLSVAVCRVSAAQQNAHTGAPHTDSEELAQAKERLLKDGIFASEDIDRIMRAGAAGAAISELEQQFSSNREQIAKRENPSTSAQGDNLFDQVASYRIASALVRLGDANSLYWDYLQEGAVDAIRSDAPDPQSFNAEEQTVSGRSGEFRAWAQSHGMTVEQAEEVITLNRAKVLYLAESGSDKAIPLLREALFSRDFSIQVHASRALARHEDTDSIARIIQICRAAPAEMARLIAAGSLASFRNSQARDAAKEFLNQQ